MASNVGRWMKYAKAKLDDTLGSANEELDELEAEREARTADKPWLTAEGDAPTLDEVRSRIEAQSAAASTADGSAAPENDPAPTPPGSADDLAADEPAADGPSTDDLRSTAEAAELSQAKLELEARERASAERLDQIRRELGVAPPNGPTP